MKCPFISAMNGMQIPEEPKQNKVGAYIYIYIHGWFGLSSSSEVEEMGPGTWHSFYKSGMRRDHVLGKSQVLVCENNAIIIFL